MSDPAPPTSRTRRVIHAVFITAGIGWAASFLSAFIVPFEGNGYVILGFGVVAIVAFQLARLLQP